MAIGEPRATPGSRPSSTGREHPNLESAKTSWPAPTRLVISGLQNSTYEGNVILPVRLALAAWRRSRALADVHVAVDYAACSNICVPYHADLALTLPHRARNGLEGGGARSPTARAAVPVAPSEAGIEVLRQAFVGNGAERALVVDLRSDTGLPVLPPRPLHRERGPDGIPPAPAVELERRPPSFRDPDGASGRQCDRTPDWI